MLVGERSLGVSCGKGSTLFGIMYQLAEFNTQHLSTPGFAKISPLWGRAGFYFGFILTYWCVSACPLGEYTSLTTPLIPLSINTEW
jgi:hypothetical protein